MPTPTSTLPHRTRSLRRPSTSADPKSKSSASSNEAAPHAPTTRSRTGDAADGSRKTTRPPSTSTSDATTSRLTRAGSLSQRTAANSSRPGASNASMPPPPRPTNGRPTMTSDAQISALRRPSLASDKSKGGVTRSGSRTVAEPSAIPQRQPSTRHSRATSTSSVSFLAPQPPAAKHARHNSITQLGPSTTLKPAAPERESRQAPNPALHRPAFSTLQQHYSPAKSLAPKPSAASILAPPSPSKLPANVAMSAETAKLQAELLQLHLLHRDAGSVQAQWRDSAKEKLGAKFEGVVRKHEELMGLERAHYDRINAVALKSWAEKAVPGWGMEERVQALDEAVTGLWSMGEAGGKYARIVKRFEKWVSEVARIHEAREKGCLQDDGEVVFVEEIDGPWGDECRTQRRKLEGWKDKLERLGDVERRSSLAAVVGGCRAMAEGMLRELETMKRLEKGVMKDEQRWIREMIAGPDGEEDEQLAGPVWRKQLAGVKG